MISRRTSTESQQADSLQAGLLGRRVDDAEVQVLVGQAEALCAAAAHTAPSVDFRVSLRERLMTEAAMVLVPAEVPRAIPTPTPAPAFRRRVARAAAAMIVAVGGVGIVASSAQAVPGDMLYSVKRGVENVELALHRSDASKGEYQLSQARERLAEADHLIGSGASDAAIADSLADVRSTAEAGSDKLFEHFAAKADESSIAAVSKFVNDASAQLAALSVERPTHDGDALSLTADTLLSIASQAQSLCGACAEIEVAELVSAAPAPVVTPTTPAPAPQPAAEVAAPPAPEAPVVSQPSAAAPSPQAPSPSVVPPAVPEIPIVTPLLGALLGDETQEGLVPGLLNGLLGR